ncbi:hypothetical protein AB0I35_30280 [Nocardia sp. NPDC050378]|uniref:hypothetical protein n=1 Tax=Nocardia sp. NPDC050378 TaxID=3155400 RepID=UPI0033CBD78B
MTTAPIDAELAQRNHAVDVIASIGENFPDRTSNQILCSRDSEVIAAKSAMMDLIPADFPGITRLFMPFAPQMPADGTGRFSAYTSRLRGGATVAEHSLVGSDYALKVVISGSIVFRGRTLTAGDWLWIPGGASYSYTAESLGAMVFTILPCVGETAETSRYTAEFDRIDEIDRLIRQQAAGEFITSRDPFLLETATTLRDLRLIVEEADGVDHHVLPFAPHMPTEPSTDGRFFAWLSMLEPGAVVPRHTHPLEKIADFKVVVNGSIHCKGHELIPGDWLWAPTGGSYEFSAGPAGALLVAGWPWN